MGEPGTAIIFSPRYLDHKTGFGHPESPRRLEAAVEGLERSSLLRRGREARIVWVEPEPADLEALRLVHESEYINLVKDICSRGGGLLGSDETVLSSESFEVASLAVGGALKAVEEVMDGVFKNSFALVRPPGHHAGPDYSLGFCIFNNVAVAAAHLVERRGLSRVLVLDIDAHHGNGTQEAFYSTKSVLYISLHQDPWEFPGTGFVDEVGVGDGLGYNVNIVLPFGCGDPSYWRAIRDIVVPVAQQYKPQFILVSAGFDGYYRDSVADLSLSAFIYPRVFRVLLELAERVCGGRLVAVLEGGYSLGFLRKVVPSVVAEMAGIFYRVSDRRPKLNLAAEIMAEKMLEDVRLIQSRFWSL